VVGASASTTTFRPSGASAAVPARADPPARQLSSSLAAGRHPLRGRIVRPLIGERHFLGHEWIDRDLRAIADGWLSAVTCERIAFPFFLARMQRLMLSHFEREAELMRLSGGALCECHRNEHRMLIDVCDRARTSGIENWPRTQSLLRNRFPKLFRDHVAGMDQIAVLFIDANRGALAR
jgi:hypothetical protein